MWERARNHSSLFLPQHRFPYQLRNASLCRDLSRAPPSSLTRGRWSRLFQTPTFGRLVYAAPSHPRAAHSLPRRRPFPSVRGGQMPPNARVASTAAAQIFSSVAARRSATTALSSGLLRLTVRIPFLRPEEQIPLGKSLQTERISRTRDGNFQNISRGGSFTDYPELQHNLARHL